MFWGVWLALPLNQASAGARPTSRKHVTGYNNKLHTLMAKIDVWFSKAN